MSALLIPIWTFFLKKTNIYGKFRYLLSLGNGAWEKEEIPKF